ncbi:MAG: glycosyltransferase family 4 protein [Anaerolineaceae bacterium]|nr:glycosyltransferase family 4 protein [Anaerolineaceae bacterium]
MAEQSICILPKLKGPGGPSSFQSNIMAGLAKFGISTHHNVRDPSTKALLVIGGTKQISDLLYARRNGIRIVQRLDGINWLHKKKFTGITHFLRSERMNLQLSIIRKRFANAIVYQSKFTRDWWNTVYKPVPTPSTVIYNGVDLMRFSPPAKKKLRTDAIKLLVVEGSFKGGHERDLLNAVGLANRLSRITNKQVELLIAGKVPKPQQAHLKTNQLVSINWLGLIPHDQIPDLDRSAHLIFPAEINAACPNSLIEALGCGLPVISYATGSLPELVGEDGGITVPYGSNYWNLEPPDTEPLAQAAKKILENLPTFRKSARLRAEKYFNVDLMVDKYRKVLFGNP